MANRYWVGGTGSWNQTARWSDTSGGTGGFSIPTSSDIVYFNTNSGTGTVTINVTANCLNLNFEGYTGTLSGTSAFNIYGDLLIDSFTNLTWNYTGTLSLLGTLSSQTVNLPYVLINSPIIINASVSTTYTFNGDINSLKSLNISNGAVSFQSISCTTLVSNTYQTVSILAVSLTGAFTANNGTISTSNDLNCTTLTINNSANFTSNGNVYASNLIIGTNAVCVFNGLVTLLSTTLNSSIGGASATFNGDVSLGNNRILTQNSGITIFNSATATLNNCYNLVINGGTFTHNNNTAGLTLVNNLTLGSATFNVGIINCKAIAISAGVMTVNEAIQNSITATTCTITNYGILNNLGGGYFTGNLAITGYFYNNLYVDMVTSTSTITLNDGIFNTDYGIFSSGISGKFTSITINNGTFNWGNPSLNIGDIYSAELTGQFNFVQGTVNINTNVKTQRFSSDNALTRSLNLRSGITWEITGSDSAAAPITGYITWSWNIKTGNYIPGLDLSGSTIKFTNRNTTAFTTVTFGAGWDGLNSSRYGTIWFNRIDNPASINPVSGTNRVMGSAEFDNFIDGTPEPVTNPGLYNIAAHTIQFESADKFIFHDFNVNGGVNTRVGAYRISLRSVTSTSTQFIFEWAGTGIKNSYNLNIFSGIAYPYAGFPSPTDEDTWFAYNSLDNNGGVPTCIGWVFILERYWVAGGTASWNSNTNWSFISGGPSGFSVPNNKTNVIFDANSGNGPVVITSSSTCYDLDAQNFLGYFYNGAGIDNALTINNNAIFGDNSLGYQNWFGDIIMNCANKTVYLDCGNLPIANKITIQDNGNLQGTVRLLRNLNTTKNIQIYKGTFNTSDGTTNYDITCNAIYTRLSSGTYYPVSIYLNSSTINLTGFITISTIKYCWSMFSSPANYTTLDAGSSTIKIQSTGNDNIVFDTNDYASIYNNIWVDRGTSTGSTTFAVIASGLVMGELRDTTVSSHSLLFDPGFGYYFSIFNVNGSSGNIITINRSSGSTQISFNITAPVYLNYVDVRNNNGNPDNTWYVNPANSSLTNTTQWYFGTPPVTGGLKKLALLGVG